MDQSPLIPLLCLLRVLKKCVPVASFGIGASGMSPCWLAQVYVGHLLARQACPEALYNGCLLAS
eukprot:scaffold144067_cov19-Tisochrysis_lutea.AAC.3